MRKILAVAAMAALVSGCLSISQTSPTAGAASALTAQSGLPYAAGTSRTAADQPRGEYALDPKHASVIWRVRHAGVGVFVGRFDDLKGSLTFDPDHPERSSVTVRIAAASVSTGVLDDAGARAFDREIHEGVFGSPTHPNITFVSRGIRLTGPTSGDISGDLTVNGATRPVTLEASFEGGRNIQAFGRHALGFTARTMIDRKAFSARLPNPLADSFVGDQVEILIAVEFTR